MDVQPTPVMLCIFKYMSHNGQYPTYLQCKDICNLQDTKENIPYPWSGKKPNPFIGEADL